MGEIHFSAGRSPSIPKGCLPDADGGRIVARDGRAAAWMAAGYSAVTDGAASVVCSDEWEFEQAVTAATHCTAAVQCFGPDHMISPQPQPKAVISRRMGAPQTALTSGGRAIRPERLIAETLAALPPRGILVVEDESFASLIEALSMRAILLLDRIAGSARGSAVAIAVGAKAADPQRIVVAIMDPASFVAGAADLETAGRCGLAVATIVATLPDGNPPPPYEHLAAIAGGHGECVEDAGRLPLHLRNAFAAPMPTVINAIMDGAALNAGIRNSYPAGR